jgi:hypothetical protein
MSSVRGSQRGIKLKRFLNKESEWRDMEKYSGTIDQNGEKWKYVQQQGIRVETNNGNVFSNKGSEWRQIMEICSATRDQSGDK